MHHGGRHRMLLCSIIGDIKFDHLVKELSARFLHCKGTLSFCNQEIIQGSLFDNVGYCILQQSFT